MTIAERRDVARAGHVGDITTVLGALTALDPAVRGAALGALERMQRLDDDVLERAFHDESPVVRRRAATLAATHRHLDVAVLLDDDDPSVVETAAWACGEHERDDGTIVERLSRVALNHGDALAREAAVAALGAIGSEAGRAAVLAAMNDKPAIRRRAVIALTPFDGPDVAAALAKARSDRDWQVRQLAEDLGG